MDMRQEVLVVSDCTKNKSFTIYDLQYGQEIKSFPGGNSAKHSLAFIGQEYAIYGYKDKPLIKIWTLHPKAEFLQMNCPGVVSCLAVTSCGSYCIAGIEKSIYIWEVSSGSLLTSFQYHSKAVTCLQISSDQSNFISGGSDGMVLVWSLSEVIADSDKSHSVKPRHSWLDHSAEVTDIYIGAISIITRVATASKDMTCRLYELETGFPLFTVKVEFAITAVIMDNLEYFLILGSAHGDIYRINLFSANETQIKFERDEINAVFKKHEGEITCLSLSLSGKYLVSAAEDEFCLVWDMTNFSLIKSIKCNGAVTNAFVTTMPPGLNEGEDFISKVNARILKRHYDNVRDTKTYARLQQKNLSLFHLGSADEFFDKEMLIKSTESINAFNQCEVTMKDVTAINTQMYAFALSDTISEMNEASGYSDSDDDN